MDRLRTYMHVNSTDTNKHWFIFDADTESLSTLEYKRTGNKDSWFYTQAHGKTNIVYDIDEFVTQHSHLLTKTTSAYDDNVALVRDLLPLVGDIQFSCVQEVGWNLHTEHGSMRVLIPMFADTMNKACITLLDFSGLKKMNRQELKDFLKTVRVTPQPTVRDRPRPAVRPIVSSPGTPPSTKKAPHPAMFTNVPKWKRIQVQSCRDISEEEFKFHKFLESERSKDV